LPKGPAKKGKSPKSPRGYLPTQDWVFLHARSKKFFAKKKEGIGKEKLRREKENGKTGAKDFQSRAWELKI